MTIETEILTNIEKLPDSVKQAVFLYTEFLVSQYAEVAPDKTEKELEKQSFVGSMKGIFVLPLPEDFNESMESSDPAKNAMLEKKYGYGSLAGKITMSDSFDEPLEDLKDYM